MTEALATSPPQTPLEAAHAQHAVMPKLSWRIPALDGVRALAMFLVFLYHVGESSGIPYTPGFHFSLGYLLSNCNIGVDIFMNLSGFVLFWPLCKSREAMGKFSVREYAIRRVRRIVPPYYAALVFAILLPQALVAVFHLVGVSANWQPLPSWGNIVAHLLFVHTFFVLYWGTIAGVFWSLGLEAKFYIAFPFVVWAFRRIGMWTIVAMIAASLTYRVIAYELDLGATYHAQWLWNITFIGRWMEFAGGMLTAIVVASFWREQRRLGAVAGTLLFAASLALLVIGCTPLPYMIPAIAPRELLFSSAFFLGTIALCASKTPLRWLFENRLVTGLGLMSYSIFLLHQPMVYYMGEASRKILHVGPMTAFGGICTIGFALIVAVSYAFFRYIEMPFMNRPSSQRKQAAAAAPPENASETIPDKLAFEVSDSGAMAGALSARTALSSHTAP
jgi:peptidoglycan/LPS O-acetylase OafA/YrhL